MKPVEYDFICDVVFTEAMLRFENNIANIKELEFTFYLMSVGELSLIIFDEEFKLFPGRVRFFIKNRILYYLLKLAGQIG
ncbi:hypothetical protein [Sphingobacterium corticibacter]|uniref:Uncharacterized protein n=1 Tax=Sphingobacterium corticibacter TaxID=2171749 RepID=A0A2T8HNL3_9SPHI|nr:hypothetical protein [Sphingobacterium corticibacter]PVH27027.1 hypothetical protein DC487_05370 [Sphingobacterium corticibacter]